MTYMKQVNTPGFREANKLVHKAKEIMVDKGFTKEEAFGWIKAWASSAGDGIQ